MGDHQMERYSDEKGTVTSYTKIPEEWGDNTNNHHQAILNAMTKDGYPCLDANGEPCSAPYGQCPRMCYNTYNGTILLLNHRLKCMVERKDFPKSLTLQDITFGKKEGVDRACAITIEFDNPKLGTKQFTYPFFTYLYQVR